jgi:GT2 family glycosyltransferase
VSQAAAREVSVVIPALNEGDYLRRTVEQVRATLPPRGEIVVVDDGSADGCCDFLRAAPGGVRLLEPSPMRLGVSGARNKGAAAAAGEIVVFLDGHVDMRAGWLDSLCAAARDPSVGAVGPGIAVMGRPDCCGWGMRYHDAALGIEWLPAPPGVPPGEPPPAVAMLAGACIAVRRDLFDAVGGFDEGLVRWGSEDAELSLRLWMAGYEQRIVPDVTIDHLFRERHPYAVDWAGILYNQLRVAFVHFTQERIRRVIERMKPFGDFAAACALLADSDTNLRRDEVQARRSRDDDAYFARFGDIH